MTEHAPFTARAAADVLADASRYEDALRNRTEGLTWMVWGLATPAIWLSYGFAGATMEGDFPWWASFLWAPWVLAGVLTTIALWRSAALAAPAIRAGERPGWQYGLAWFLVTFVMWSLIVAWTPALNEAVVPLLVVGSAWTLFGAVNLNRCSALGRRVSVLIGAATLAVGVALVFLAPGHTARDYVVATLGSVLATAVFPLAGGLWQTLRG